MADVVDLLTGAISDYGYAHEFEKSPRLSPLETFRLIGEARDEIERLRATPAPSPMVTEWQPIETAPKDGVPVWVADRHFLRVAFWLSGKQYEHQGSVGGGWRDFYAEHSRKASDLQFAPTHWMPLPEPPK